MSSVLHTENDESRLHQITLPWRPAVSTTGGQEQRSQQVKAKTEDTVTEESGVSPYCQFDKLDRAGAERLLKDKNKNGMYVIRNGLEGLRVLSVWQKSFCYHYMIYKSEHGGTIFLTKQKLFSNLQELLHYYTDEAYLPHLDFRLHHPYHPDDGMIPTLVRSYGMHTSHTSSSNTRSSCLLTFDEFPSLEVGSAPELLDDKCRYSGWIRKQGGSHKNWKRRYMILRTGCLYYFSNETASSPKGKFILCGYHVVECVEPKKFHHMFKLEPQDPQARTYLFACSTSQELERWKFELTVEISKINQISLPRLSKSPTMPVPLFVSINSAKPQSPILSHRRARTPTCANTHHTIPSPVTPRRRTLTKTKSDPSLAYREVNHDLSDSDSSIEITVPADYLEPQSLISPEEHLPVHNYYTAIKGDNRDLGSCTEREHSNVSGGVPHQISDELKHNDLNSTSALTRQGPFADYSVASPLRINPYLTVIDNTDSLTQPVKKEYKILQKQCAISVKPAANPISLSQNSSTDSADQEYYVVFPTPEEALPSSCMFERLDRSEAERLLSSKDEEGTYLIREGSAKSGSDKVLTVWHNNHCRHYKVFKHNESYLITQGEIFNSLPALIQYYRLQSFLPQSDFYLKIPFK